MASVEEISAREEAAPGAQPPGAMARLGSHNPLRSWHRVDTRLPCLYPIALPAQDARKQRKLELRTEETIPVYSNRHCMVSGPGV